MTSDKLQLRKPFPHAIIRVVSAPTIPPLQGPSGQKCSEVGFKCSWQLSTLNP